MLCFYCILFDTIIGFNNNIVIFINVSNIENITKGSGKVCNNVF